MLPNIWNSSIRASPMLATSKHLDVTQSLKFLVALFQGGWLNIFTELLRVYPRELHPMSWKYLQLVIFPAELNSGGPIWTLLAISYSPELQVILVHFIILVGFLLYLKYTCVNWENITKLVNGALYSNFDFLRNNIFTETTKGNSF